MQVGALKAVQSVECNTGSTSSRSGGDGSVVQAIRAITAASLLHVVATKLVKINIEIDEHEKIQLDENMHLLKSLCAVLVLVGLVALTACKCCHRELNDAPRINAVRGPTEEEPDEDWSVILGSEPEGSDRELEGRFSGRGSRSLTSPVP